MWCGDGWGHMGGWGWIGAILMLLFWFGVIALIVAAIGGFGRWQRGMPTSGPSGGDSALAILRERFARGELTQDEYEQARKTLTETRR